MAAAHWKIIVEQGSTWRVALTVYDESGAPVDLTGYTARMQVRETLDAAEPLLTLTTPETSPGGITIDGPAGRLTLLIADEMSTAWAWTFGVYDLELASPDGDVDRLLKGEFEVDREVTR